jgi:hypothetical protein
LKKEIEHEKYTAPQGKRRKFVQEIESHAPGRPRRHIPMAESPLAKTIVQFDALVRDLITQGEKAPHQMAKRKFHVHRPKPANNKAKNHARRHSEDLVLGAKTPGNRPEPAVVINAAQVRHQILSGIQLDPRAVRSVIRWKRGGAGRCSVAQHRRKARKAASRVKHKARR